MKKTKPVKPALGQYFVMAIVMLLVGAFLTLVILNIPLENMDDEKSGIIEK